VKSLNYGGTGIAQLIKFDKTNNGYLRANLCINKKVKHYSVHRLVAQAFLDNPLNLPLVNHKDEIKTNNYVDNLEYCTHQYNCLYGTKMSRISKALSKPVIGVNILTNEIISFDSATHASKYDFSFSDIGACCNGKRKQHKGYKWYYEKDYYKEDHNERL